MYAEKSLRFRYVFIVCFLLLQYTVIFSQHHRPVSAAVIYLHPNYPNQIIPDTNWSSFDFSNDPQGVVFAGALAENSTLIIKNIKSLGIEVNATLSRGCTLRIEGCTIHQNSPSSTSSHIRGGIVVAPTIFRDRFDGEYSCSKAVRSSSSFSQSDFDHKVRVEVVNNFVRNFATASRVSNGGTIAGSYAHSVSAIAIYNLIVCHRSSGQDDRVVAHVNVSSNDIQLSQDTRSIFAVSIYWMNRVASDLLENFASSSSASSSLFQTVVPLSSLTIHNNIINATSRGSCVAIQVGFFMESSTGWDAKTNYYLQTSSSSSGSPSIYFDITENSFSLRGNSSTRIASLGTFGNDSALLSSASPASSPRFFLNFINQRSINVVATGGDIAVLDLLNIKFLTLVQTSVIYDRNNRNVALEQSGWSDATYITFSASRNDTTLTVSNSYFPFLVRVRVDSSAVSISNNATVGSIVIKSNLLKIIPFDRGNLWAGFWLFRSHEWRYIGNVAVENNVIENAQYLRDAVYLVNFLNVTGASDLTLGRLTHLEGTYGLGAGNITLRNNKMTGGSRENCVMLQFNIVPRVGVSSLENNTMTSTCRSAALVRHAIEYNLFSIIAKSLIMRNNIADFASDYSEQAVAMFAYLDLVSVETGGTFVIEHNIFRTTGFASSSFVSGGFTADPADPNSSVVLRHNFFHGDAVHSASFVTQALVLSPPLPLLRFNMKRIVIEGNRVNVTSRSIASFVSSSIAEAGYTFNLQYTLPSSVVWVLEDNDVEVSCSLNALGLWLANQKIEELHVINTTLRVRNRLDPPIFPSFLTHLAALLRPESRFSVFTRSNISQVFLASSSSTTSSATTVKPCSTYNSVQLTDRLFEKSTSTKITGFNAHIVGDGVATVVEEIVPGACARAPSVSSSLSGSARSFSISVPDNSSSESKITPTRTNEFIHHHYTSPLKQATVAISSTTVIVCSLVASAALASSALQTRAILSGVNSILDGNCRISQETLEERPDISSSPLQLYIGGGYASGVVVGNFSFIIVFLILWHGAFIIVQKVFKKKNSPRPFSLQSFADSKILSPATMLSMMFLDPFINSTVVVLAVPTVLIGLKVICTLMSVVFLVLFGAVVFKLLFSRRVCEKFVRIAETNEEKSAENPLIRFNDCLVGIEGEWKCQQVGKTHREKGETRGGFKVTKQDALSFQFAFLLIKGYTDRFPRFIVCDILVVFGVALGTVVGHLTNNCTVLGVIQILVIAVHAALGIIFRPDRLRLRRVANPFLSIIRIVLLVLALAGVNQDSVSRLILCLVCLQLVLTVVGTISFAVFANKESIDGLIKRFCSSTAPKKRTANQSRRAVTATDNDDDNDNDDDELALQLFVHPRGRPQSRQADWFKKSDSDDRLLPHHHQRQQKPSARRHRASSNNNGTNMSSSFSPSSSHHDRRNDFAQRRMEGSDARHDHRREHSSSHRHYYPSFSTSPVSNKGNKNKMSPTQSSVVAIDDRYESGRYSHHQPQPRPSSSSSMRNSSGVGDVPRHRR